jgi:hypothetical protein
MRGLAQRLVVLVGRGRLDPLRQGLGLGQIDLDGARHQPLFAGHLQRTDPRERSRIEVAGGAPAG